MYKDLSTGYKTLMSKHVQSVNLVTTFIEKSPRSCTISSLVSVSVSDVDNPILAISLKKSSEMASLLKVGSVVWVHLLSSEQVHLAQYYSKFRVGENNFVFHDDKKIALPGSIGSFDLNVISMNFISESVVFFCKVLEVELSSLNLSPLTYYLRDFNGSDIS